MVRRAVEALPASSKVAVLASGSFSLDVGGHLAPRGEFAGTPDVGWANTVLGHLRNGRTNDLLNEATSDRLARGRERGWRAAQLDRPAGRARPTDGRASWSRSSSWATPTASGGGIEADIDEHLLHP